MNIAINIAKTVMTELIQHGRIINRPWIGISYVKITRQLAQYYRLPTTEGVLIAHVESDKLTMTINRYGRRFEVPIQLRAQP